MKALKLIYKNFYKFKEKGLTFLFFYCNMYITTKGKEKEMDIHVTNVDRETKYKAMYACKCKGTDLSTEIKKMVEQIAKDFEKNLKGE